MNNTAPIAEEGIAIDEFEEAKEIPTRVDLKRKYPQSAWVIVEKTFWFLLAIGLVMLGLYRLGDPSLLADAAMQDTDRGVRIIFYYLLRILIVATSIRLAYELLHHMMYNYTIELEHLVITRGVFMRTRASFPIAKINDASLTRNLIELVLGLYTLDILTASPTLTTGSINGLRKKEAVDLQAYLMLLVETTLPQISKKAIEIIKEREITTRESELMEVGELPGKDSPEKAAQKAKEEEENKEHRAAEKPPVKDQSKKKPGSTHQKPEQTDFTTLLTQ